MSDTIEGRVVKLGTDGQPVDGFLPVKLERAHTVRETGAATYQREIVVEGLNYYVDFLPSSECPDYLKYRELEKAHGAALKALNDAGNEPAPETEPTEEERDANELRLKVLTSNITIKAQECADYLFLKLVKGWGTPVTRTNDEKREFILPDKQDVNRAIIGRCIIGVDASFLGR